MFALVASRLAGGSFRTFLKPLRTGDLMPTTATPSVDEDAVVPLKAPTLGWALRRALLAIVILFFSISSVAWLLYASIDPEQTDTPAAKSSGERAPATPGTRQGASIIGSEKTSLRGAGRL
jgi:hypothetical protein